MSLPRIPSWLPNAISCSRFFALPIWVLAVYGLGPFQPSWQAGAIIILVLGVTDVLDGWLARTFELSSPTGAALDASADKFAQFLVFTTLAFAPPPGFFATPIWFVALVFLRDLTMLVGLVWIWNKRSRLQVQHRQHGKLASLLVFVLMIGAHLPAHPAHPVAYAAVALVIFFSTVLYMRDGIRVLRRTT